MRELNIYKNKKISLLLYLYSTFFGIIDTVGKSVRKG